MASSNKNVVVYGDDDSEESNGFTKNSIEYCDDRTDRISISSYEGVCETYSAAYELLKGRELALGEPALVPFKYNEKVYMLLGIGSGEYDKPYTASGVTRSVVNEAVYIDASTGQERRLGDVIVELYSGTGTTLEGRVKVLEASMDKVTGNIADISVRIVDEASARTAADSSLLALINKEIADRKAADEAEVTARNEAIEAKTGDLDYLTTENKDNLVEAINEINRGAGADLGRRVSKLEVEMYDTSVRIETEISDRQAADTSLHAGIESESLARQAADSSIQADISTEASARQAADTGLDERIKVLEAIHFPFTVTLSMSDGTTLYEYTGTPVSKIFTWTAKTQGVVTPDRVTLKVDSGTAIENPSQPYTLQINKYGTTTVRVDAELGTGESKKTAYSTKSVTMINKMIIGFGDASISSLSDIQGLADKTSVLTSNPKGDKYVKSTDLVNNKYLWFCVDYTQSLNPSKATQGPLPFPLNSEVVVDVDGVHMYRCYRSTNLLEAGYEATITLA